MSNQSSFEWFAFDGAAPLAARRPGAVVRDAAGRACVLHVAPGRWFLPEPDAALQAELQAAAAAGRGVLTDVTGRWRRLHLPTPAAGGHPLQAGVAPDLVLRDRDVASLWIFDCPVLLARCGADFEVWVEASYEAGFRGMLARIEENSRS